MFNPEMNVSLADLTTFHVGGPAAFLIRVKTAADLTDAFSFAQEKNLPVFILGGGSNILVSDEGFDGMVVKMEIGSIEFIEKGDGIVEAVVGAGEDWDHFVAETVRRGLYGLENLSGIPGTVGAAPIQNIGAYGTEVNSCITWVEVFDQHTNTAVKLSNAECRFAYRDSVFKRPEGKRFIVTRVCFILRRDGTLNISYKDVADRFAANAETPTLEKVRKAILAIRGGKFPDLREVGTAGSFFKNPIVSLTRARLLKGRYPDMPQFSTESGVKIPAAWILDHVLSLKGKRDGAVGTFSNQPLVLVHYGGGTAHDIDVFAKEIERNVKEKMGLVLEREVRTVQTP